VSSRPVLQLVAGHPMTLFFGGIAFCLCVCVCVFLYIVCLTLYRSIIAYFILYILHIKYKTDS